MTNNNSPSKLIGSLIYFDTQDGYKLYKYEHHSEARMKLHSSVEYPNRLYVIEDVSGSFARDASKTMGSGETAYHSGSGEQLVLVSGSFYPHVMDNLKIIDANDVLGVLKKALTTSQYVNIAGQTDLLVGAEDSLSSDWILVERVYPLRCQTPPHPTGYTRYCDQPSHTPPDAICRSCRLVPGDPAHNDVCIKTTFVDPEIKW